MVYVHSSDSQSSSSNSTVSIPRSPEKRPKASSERSEGYPYSPSRSLRHSASYQNLSPTPSFGHPPIAYASTAKVGRRISMNGNLMGGAPGGGMGSIGGNGNAVAGPSSPHSIKGMGDEEADDPAYLRQRITDLESAFSSQNTYIHMLETSLRTSSTSSSSSSNSHRSSLAQPSTHAYPPSLSRRSSRIPMPAAHALPTPTTTVSASSSTASTNTLRAGLTHSAPIYDLRGTAESAGTGVEGGGARLGDAIDLGDGGEGGLGVNGDAHGRVLRGSGSHPDLRSGVLSSLSGIHRMPPVPGSPALDQVDGQADGQGKRLDGIEETASPARASEDKRNSTRLGLSLIPRSRVQSAVSHIDQPTASSTARRTSISSSRPSSRASSRGSNRAVSPIPGEPSSSTTGPSGLTSPINLHPNSAKTSPFGGPSNSGTLSSPIDMYNGTGNGLGARPGMPRKASSAMGGSGKVIEALNKDLEASKVHLERVRAELRQSQRLIEQFTRQTADLQETKERMRTEAEGLNGLIARKERLLEEVLIRARKAETELALVSREKKATEISTKKQIDQMTSELEESQTKSKRAEREALALKDGHKGMKDSWARELKAVRVEIKANADNHKQELEEARQKHAEVSKLLLLASKTQKTAVEGLQEEKRQLSTDVNNVFKPQIEAFRLAIDKEDEELEKMKQEIDFVNAEMARIKRLMRAPDGM